MKIKCITLVVILIHNRKLIRKKHYDMRKTLR